jgi:hypothetical protein
MVHIDPAWFEAAATGIVAAEGVPMHMHKKKAEAAAATGPAAPTVVMNGISGQDFLMGVLMMTGAMLVLAVAMLASAAVIHHGLTA